MLGQNTIHIIIYTNIFVEMSYKRAKKAQGNSHHSIY